MAERITRSAGFEAGSLLFLVTIGILAAASTGSLFAAGFILLQQSKPAIRAAAVSTPPARLQPADRPASAAAATPRSPGVTRIALAPPASTPPHIAKPPPAHTLPTAARLATAQGEARFADGDLAAARFFYERAIDAGDAAAAVRMGETFDPDFLTFGRRHRVRGDASAARYWYERGLALGAAGARERLDRLETEPAVERSAARASRTRFHSRAVERYEPSLHPPKPTLEDVIKEILHPQGADTQARRTKDPGP